jgi:hypothetical protein
MAQSSLSGSVIKIISGSKGKFPIKLGIVPERLAVTIFRHVEHYQGAQAHCLSYVTEGLLALGQKELLLSLLINENVEDSHFPSSPFPFFIAIYKQALQKKHVTMGDITNLGVKGLFGFVGVGYSFVPHNLMGFTSNRATLCCVLLTKHEWVIAQNYSLTRVLTLLEHMHKRFPFLPWVDRRRADQTMNKAVLNSILKNTPKTVVKNASVFMAQGDVVILQVPRETASRLSALLLSRTDKNSFALVLQLLPQHDGYLVWRAETGETEFNTAPNAHGAALAGGFLQLDPGGDNDGVSINEDGFCLSLCSSSWEAFKSALERGQKWGVKGEQGAMSFSLYIGEMGQQALSYASSLCIDDNTNSANENLGVLLTWFGRMRSLLRRD